MTWSLAARHGCRVVRGGGKIEQCVPGAQANTVLAAGAPAGHLMGGMVIHPPDAGFVFRHAKRAGKSAFCKTDGDCYCLAHAEDFKASKCQASRQTK